MQTIRRCWWRSAGSVHNLDTEFEQSQAQNY
jgi:hypothetical protein